MARLKFVPPMEAKLVSELPSEGKWQFEPKWDGFRCIAIRDDDHVDLWAKSGKDLGRYFPEIIGLVRGLPHRRFILDGELIVVIDGEASFDALQQRLHPADSRIRRLSRETPAMLVAFDLLHLGARDLTTVLLKDRRSALESFLDECPETPSVRISPATTNPSIANRWFRELSSELDGVIAKRLDEPYASGERAMLKIKRVRSADCVVGGFRYGTGDKLVGSLLLGLFNADGKLDHIGFTSAISAKEKPELTRTLEKLKGGPGFTGKAPGGPSRWTTERSSEWVPLEQELVVEVGYDQITGDRFRHGTKLLRWRPDKAPRQCTFEQLACPVEPDAIIRSTVSRS